MDVFERLKWFCGREFYLNKYTPFTYKVLTEDKLRTSLLSNDPIFGEDVPFTEWEYDGKVHRVVLVNRYTGLKMEYAGYQKERMCGGFWTLNYIDC
jgi:hypothetical protein